MNRRLLDYTPEMELPDEAERPFGAAQASQHAAMAFGADLLEVTNEAELEQFLADLVTAVAAADRTPVDAQLGNALVAELKRAARPLMPIRSSGAGEPGFGGADLKTKAARIFGMELEGLSPEDKEFEVAQQFIRLAATAIRNAAAAANAGAPRTVAAGALHQAARDYAPGLLQLEAQAAALGGRWRRAGGRIIVFDC